MIYVITETVNGGWFYPTAYYTSAEGARRAVKSWADAYDQTGLRASRSLSGMSAFVGSNMIRATPVEEGTA